LKLGNVFELLFIPFNCLMAMSPNAGIMETFIANFILAFVVTGNFEILLLIFNACEQTFICGKSHPSP
jgi:hypothetical protein